MMSKLFQPIQESHDPLNRIVFLCQDANGFYVYKPANGFRSRHFDSADDEDCVRCFDGQVSNGQVHAGYDEFEAPAAGEEYPPVADEDPVVEEPVVEEPIVEEPVVEEPVVEEPVVEAPVVEEPVVKATKPATKSAAKKTVKKKAVKKAAKKTAKKKATKK